MLCGKSRLIQLACAGILCMTGALSGVAAEPATSAAPAPETKEQRDARMAWWREARFGMFIHWGPYAVPAGQYDGKKIPGLGEWIMYDARIPVARYETYAKAFNPVKFNADEIVGIAKAAGMKYLVITAKHCDGFAMFPSKASKYNITDATPFKRDPMAELAKACAAQGIKLCFYYSHCWDWHEPDAPGFINNWDFGPIEKRKPDVYFKQKSLPQVEELVSQYKPALLWFDVPDLAPQRSQEFLNVIRKHVPDCVVNDRVGNDLGDYLTPEQFIPPNGFPGRDWETCMTINDTWGYKTHDSNFKSTETLLRNLIDIVSKGGNYLLNVGPTAEGVIPEPEVQRLKEIGRWMDVNSEAIHGATASPFKKLDWGRCTQKPERLFLHVFNWPKKGLFVPGLKSPVEEAYLLADPKRASLPVSQNEEGVTVTLPAEAPDKIASVVVLEISGPADVVYTFPQAADGSVKLPAIDATIHGSTARHDSAMGNENIGFWSDIKDWVDWNLSVKKAGEFDVEVTYACNNADAGSEFTVEVAGKKLTGKVEGTGGWTKLVTKNLGRIEIAAGRHTLAVRATTMPKGAVMDLRSVVLKPAPAQAAVPESKEQRNARMAWWREARFGMFIHWGLYAVPAGQWKGKFAPPGGAEWIMNTFNIPVEEYASLAKQFNPLKYDPAAWVRTAKEAGVKYIVITSKHHDGFGIFDTKATDYNVAKATPYGKDLLKPLADECRKQGIKFCTYYSIMDWHHPAQYRGSPQGYNATKIHPERKAEYVAFMKQQLKELLDGVNPEVLWFDGQWPQWWTETDAVDVANYLRTLKPSLIVNNRLGTGRTSAEMGGFGKHDKPYVGDFDTPEQDIPATGLAGVDWETCMTMNGSWGYRTDDTNWKSTEQLVRQLIDAVSKGGNYLLNVGPTAEGEIPAASVERLQGMGKWMATNGEAIYGATASPFKKLDWGRCTQKPGKLFLHVFDWPRGELKVPGLKNRVKQAYLLADAKENGTVQLLEIKPSAEGVTLKLPEKAPDAIASVVVLEIEGAVNVAQ
jgi:alpha-L-fucosidase